MSKYISTFKLVTYNIEFSKREELIIQNLIKMKNSGVNIFCLQEVCYYTNKEFFIDKVLKTLGNNWQAEYFIGAESNYQLNHGVAIIWDEKIFKLHAVEKIELPKIKSFSLHEIFIEMLGGFLGKPMQRKAITVTFLQDKNKIRISTLHLDLMGGPNHRSKQIKSFLEYLNNKPLVSGEIICGDFNIFDALNSGKEYLSMLSIFRKYTYSEASSNVSWTLDILNTDFSKYIIYVLKKLNIQILKKLDYIWIKDLKVIRAERLEISGSDHFPLIATISIN